MKTSAIALVLVLASAVTFAGRPQQAPSRAPYTFAAVTGMRPSPEPRSYTTSLLVTPAAFSMPSTTDCRVGT